jgi:hypothetical protein
MRRLALSVAVLAVALTACSGTASTSSSPPVSRSASDVAAASVPAPLATGARAATLISESVDKTAEQENARMSGRVTIEWAGETRTLPLEGALDFDSGAFEFAYDLSRLGVPSAETTIRARMVDDVMYVSFGDVAGAAGRALSSILDGREWLALDLAAVGMGADNGTGGGLAHADPGGVLDLLREIGEVETVGPETVRGVPTTHYRGTIDIASVPVDVWVDGDGRARKISATVDRAGIKVATEIEYYDFGVELDVDAPPADEVLDFTELFGDVPRPTPVAPPV